MRLALPVDLGGKGGDTLDMVYESCVHLSIFINVNLILSLTIRNLKYSYDFRKP